MMSSLSLCTAGASTSIWIFFYGCCINYQLPYVGLCLLESLCDAPYTVCFAPSSKLPDIRKRAEYDNTDWHIRPSLHIIYPSLTLCWIFNVLLSARRPIFDAQRSTFNIHQSPITVNFSDLPLLSSSYHETCSWWH
ncbi:hypothetical protein C8Q75DRAFT_592640 [Abortiporus biennis]|nr:hypothetical protein C8Q75DRAFT_592640 [Abortiporus biennis]